MQLVIAMQTNGINRTCNLWPHQLNKRAIEFELSAEVEVVHSNIEEYLGFFNRSIAFFIDADIYKKQPVKISTQKAEQLEHTFWEMYPTVSFLRFNFWWVNICP